MVHLVVRVSFHWMTNFKNVELHVEKIVKTDYIVSSYPARSRCGDGWAQDSGGFQEREMYPAPMI